MKFKKTDVAGAVEILASNDFTAIPFTTTTAKKAGEKLTVDSRVGVVLYDVDPDENPNGSLLAIEGITSPDGRVLGKMGHTERRGHDLYKNVPGDTSMPLFENGVKYFTR